MSATNIFITSPTADAKKRKGSAASGYQTNTFSNASTSNNNLTFTPHQSMENRIEAQELFLDDDEDYMLDDEASTPFYMVPQEFGSAVQSRARTNSGSSKQGALGLASLISSSNTTTRSKRMFCDNLFDSNSVGITRSVGHLNLSLSSRPPSPDILVTSNDLEQKHHSINEKIATWSPFNDYTQNTNTNTTTKQDQRQNNYQQGPYGKEEKDEDEEDEEAEEEEEGDQADISVKRKALKLSNYMAEEELKSQKEISNVLKKWNSEKPKHRTLKNRNGLTLTLGKENDPDYRNSKSGKESFIRHNLEEYKSLDEARNSNTYSEYFTKISSSNPSSNGHQQHTAKIRKKSEQDAGSKLSFINAKPDQSAFASQGLVSKLKKTSTHNEKNLNWINNENCSVFPNTPMKKLPFLNKNTWQKQSSSHYAFGETPFNKHLDSRSGQQQQQQQQQQNSTFTIQEHTVTDSRQSGNLFSGYDNFHDDEMNLFSTSPMKQQQHHHHHHHHHHQHRVKSSSRVVLRTPFNSSHPGTKKMNRQSTILNNNELSNTLQKFKDDLYGTTESATESLFNDSSPIQTPTKRINKLRNTPQQQQAGQAGLLPPLPSTNSKEWAHQSFINSYEHAPHQPEKTIFDSQHDKHQTEYNFNVSHPTSLMNTNALSYEGIGFDSPLRSNSQRDASGYDFSGLGSMYNNESRSEASYLLTKFSHVELMGQGAFSTVYKVKDGQNSHFFAVKCIVPKSTMKQIVLNEISVLQSIQEQKQNKTVTLETRENATWLGPFDGGDYEEVKREHVGSRENVLQQNLVHERQIVEGKEYVFDFITSWKHSSNFFIVSEYYENGTLNDFIQTNVIDKKTRLEDWRVWKIIVEIAQGLRFLHEVCKIVHLDIKPCNIFVTFEGCLKIGDFGMSTKLPLESKAFENEGDREYIAPEIISEGIYDFRADIFSLGLMIVEIACNVCLPDNGTAWHKLRSGDLSDAGRLSSTDIQSEFSNTTTNTTSAIFSTKLSKITQLSSASNYLGQSKLQELESQTGTKVPAWVPKFLIDGQSLNKTVKWMIEPDYRLRPSADDLLKSEECEYVQMTKKCGATIHEDNFGPKPDFFM
ncbi:hypothetical protein ACO0QE_002159 [Hanseniaspora vineae]